MKCWMCGKKFKNNEQLLPLYTYVVNERRGDFTHQTHNVFVHAKHLMDATNAMVRNRISGQNSN